jgi:hypothetical protein
VLRLAQGRWGRGVLLPVLQHEAAGHEQGPLVVEVTGRLLGIDRRHPAALLHADHVPEGVDPDPDDLLHQLVAEQLFLGRHRVRSSEQPAARFHSPR